MASHMPPIPPANRNKKVRGVNAARTQGQALKAAVPQNVFEQGDTANIKQNTTNKGFFQGRRMNGRSPAGRGNVCLGEPQAGRLQLEDCEQRDCHFDET